MWISLIILAVIALVLWLFTRQTSAVPTQVQVSITGLPMDAVTGELANKWQIIIIDTYVNESRAWGTQDNVNIEGVAVFDIPPHWKFPLAVSIDVYYKWELAGEWHGRQLYSVQSWKPETSYYKEVYIEEVGNYRYNVDTELFEKIEGG